jgi:C4-dicarboxylate transporter, DctM subunit
VKSEPALDRQPLVRRIENVSLSVLLAAMVVLPLIEIAARPFLHGGIAGSITIVRYLTVFIGMLGGAIAAREGRLLSLSTLTEFLPGKSREFARLFSSAVSAAVTAVLSFASWQFVVQEKSGITEVLPGIPTWIALTILPVGFGMIALRLISHAGKTWKARGIALVLAAVCLFAVARPLLPADRMVLPALGILLAATVMGGPVFVTLGGAALILFWGQDQPVAAVPIAYHQQVINPALPAIPLFTLAGYLLAEGGASKRMIRVFQDLFGHFRGGPAIAAVLVCAFFTSFTGASGVTILALGGLLMPVLLSSGYRERGALGLLTSGGSLGLLWPPCLPMILYAIVAEISMKQMFLGGIIPGFLLVILTALYGISQSLRRTETASFSWRRARAALAEAKWELLLPVVVLVALFGGFATPVEAAALTAAYALVVEAFVYRDLRLTRELPHAMVECGLLIGGVLLILGVALGFTNYLIDAQIPDLALEWAKRSISSPWVFLLGLNGFLLVVGCLMDIYSAIVVVVPLIVPIGAAFGIDPVHLGIVFLANLELGYLTPPVGMNLFLSSYRFGKPLPEVIRAIVPILLIMLGGVLLITYVPPLSTFLPRLFK